MSFVYANHRSVIKIFHDSYANNYMSHYTPNILYGTLWLDLILQVCETYRHVNLASYLQDMFGDFQKIQDRIEDMLSVLNPRAKLLKEGASTEITSNNHKKQLSRYMFLVRTITTHRIPELFHL